MAEETQISIWSIINFFFAGSTLLPCEKYFSEYLLAFDVTLLLL